MNLRKLAGLSIVTGALASGMSPAHAGLMLFFDAGNGYEVTVIDNGTGDADSALGIISYTASSGSLGNWFLSTTIGVDLSTPSSAKLDLFSVDANSTSPLGGASTLTIKLTNSGMTAPALTDASGLTAVGGTTDGVISFGTYFNGGMIASLGPFGTGPSSHFSGAVGFDGLDTTGGFDLTNLAVIEHSGSGFKITSFDMVTTLPEPAALGLLGLGLLGCGFARRRNPA